MDMSQTLPNTHSFTDTALTTLSHSKEGYPLICISFTFLLL